MQKEGPQNTGGDSFSCVTPACRVPWHEGGPESSRCARGFSLGERQKGQSRARVHSIQIRLFARVRPAVMDSFISEACNRRPRLRVVTAPLIYSFLPRLF